ncbi:methyltransferase domain-containing protein [Clostridium senegalense]|uniref:MerR family transcriptional regulator n=1 Tax=Clostridium senegalense TaxID=1465809 RepID=UPI001C0F5CD4|nr:methyltransferase domain-containing protein [Clostridium senegalense]MBU5227887.1 methyltransferase domain-containing protein [Clostridium senegalense]
MNHSYSISEVANIFNITTNKIRYYEKKGLLKPLRDSNNEYRKFNDEDIMTLQLILLYRSIGLSISDIKDIIENKTNKNYLNHFNDQWEIVNDEIQRLTIVRDSLENILDKLYMKEECGLDSDILDVIKRANKISDIKNNWKDKWNFNDWAKSYDKTIVEDRGEVKVYKNYNLILDKVYNLASENSKKGFKFLEIGVGTGNLSSKFLRNNCDIVGIDQSREMLSIAKKKYPKLKVRLGEFLKIPYSDKSFDIIVSTYAFHHLNENEKVIAIEEMIRVLKDNGKIIIGDLMFKDVDDKRYVLKSLTKEQIEEVEDEYYTNIDFLKKEFRKFDKNLSYERIDTFNYIVKII